MREHYALDIHVLRSHLGAIGSFFLEDLGFLSGMYGSISETVLTLRTKISELYLATCPCHLFPVQPTILVEYLIEKRAVILDKNNIVYHLQCTYS